MGELDFENVVFGYGGNTLFNGFSASFAKGQISCIVGPNGCGKSTLAKLAMGLIKPASGRVLIQGRDVASLNPRERARRLGVLVQQQEAPMMTVRELAACGRFPHTGRYLGSTRPMRNALTRRFLLRASTIYATDRCEAYRAGSGNGRAWRWCWRRTHPSCCSTSPHRSWMRRRVST